MTMRQNRRGRPPKALGRLRDIRLDVRLEGAEKEAFRVAAELAGLDLSAWIRERLRWAATRELEAAMRPIPFLRYDHEESE
jgi:hypothetical protein